MCVGGSVGTLLRVFTVGSVVGLLSARSIGVLAVEEGPAHFQPFPDLCANGEVAIPIDRTFSLEEIPAPTAYVGHERALAKVVILPS